MKLLEYLHSGCQSRETLALGGHRVPFLETHIGDGCDQTFEKGAAHLMTSETASARRFFEMSLFVITSELSRKSQEQVWNLTRTQHSTLFSCSPGVG